jgi:hypothetical protein
MQFSGVNCCKKSLVKSAHPAKRPLMAPKLSRVFLAIALLSSAFLSTARAVDFDWNGSVDNDWLNGANWTPLGPPSGGAGNFAYIRNGGTARISADIPQVQDVFVGRGAATSGTLNQTAGNATNTGWTFVGTDGGTGTYNLTGTGGTLGSGSLTTGRLYVGGVRDLGGGTGTMRMNSTGTITLSSDFAISTRGGNGTFTLDAGNIVAGSWMIVGETHNGVGGGTGTFIQNGGSLSVGAVDAGGRLWLGSQEGSASTIRSTGNYTLNNGTLTTTELVVGRHYDGNFTQNAGTVTTTARGTVVGAEAGSIGNFIIGGNSTFTQNTPANVEDSATWNTIGNNGTATFNLSGTAKVSFSARTHLGLGGTGVGTVTQTGGIFEVRDHELILGDTGRGTYNISGGTLQTFNGRPINVGHWNNSVGNLNVSGTALVQSGGDMNVGNGDTSAGVTAVANGTVTQTGGTVKVGVGGAGNLNIGTDLEAIGLYKLQGGTLDLTGGNISRGLGSATFTMTDGVLTGVGTIAGNSADNTFTQQGGILEVGALPGAGGASTVNGNYSLLASGALKLEITSAAVDQLTVNGTVSIAGQLNLQQLNPIPAGNGFVILANDGADPVVGAFSNAPNGVPFTFGGNGYIVYYNAGDGNDIVLIPEPSAILALGGGLAILLGRRRRREF